MSILNYVEATFSVLVLIMASIFDIKTRKIPNWYILCSAILALIISSFHLILFSNYRVLLRLVFVVFVFLFGSLRLIGLGDIKLIMVLAILNHPITILLSIALACICILCYAALKKPSETRLQVSSGLEILRTRNTKNALKNFCVPFAPALTIGYCVIGGIYLFYV